MESRRGDPKGQTRSDRREPKQPDSTGREVAPPIEREHETYAGIFEEDERRDHGRQT